MILTFVGFSYSSIGAEIKVGASTDRTVSPYLTGMNTVYSHESMKTWEDGKKVRDLKEAGIGCLRYPGGHVVSFWDWEFPYHSAYQNFWKPAYAESLTTRKKAELKQQHDQRMVLTDFFRICNDAHIEPIMGINMFQGYKFNRLEDSVAKAVQLVEYCKKQRPRVKYYFLDNEAGHQPTKGNHIPIDDYIRLIPVYSKAIKGAQPDAKLIVNPIGWGRVGEMIQKSGAHFDIVDRHWYYSNRKWGLFYIKDWRAEEKSRKFEREANQFRAWKEKSGHDHLKLGLLEWNMGPATGEEDSDKSTYLTQGLVQADMLMQFIDHDVFMAAAWPLMWAPSGKKNTGVFRNFFDHKTGKASPSKHIFRWFSMAGNGTVLECESPTAEGIRATSILHKDGKTILLYVLNKSKDNRDVTVELRKPFAVVSATSFQAKEGVVDPVAMDLPTQTKDQTIAFKMTGTSFVFLMMREE